MSHLLMAQVNPLACPEIERTQPESTEPPPADRLLDYLIHPEGDRSLDAFVARYREIDTVPGSLLVAPSERTILDKLVWPLRHAKGSYALANYFGCIALCGMVGEMVAILLWDISKPPLLGRPMTEVEQKAMFGRTFERLGQERRVEVLQALGLIDAETRTRFDAVRNIRNRYLHLLSQGHEALPRDARDAFGASLHLVSIVLGQTFRDGSVLLRPELTHYLEEKDIIRSAEVSER